MSVLEWLEAASYLVTIVGLQFSFLLAGTIIIENVFNLPGVGRLVFQAIAQRDLVRCGQDVKERGQASGASASSCEPGCWCRDFVWLYDA